MKSLYASVYFIYIAHFIATVALAKVLHTDTNYTVKGLKTLIQSNNKSCYWLLLIRRIPNSSTASQEFCAKATEKNCNSSRLWPWCCNQCVLSLIRSKAGTHTGRFRDLLSKWSCSYSIIYGGHVWVCFMGNWGWLSSQNRKSIQRQWFTIQLVPGQSRLC